MAPPQNVPADQVDEIKAEREGVRVELADRVRQAVRMADDIDNDLRGLLSRICQGAIYDAGATDNTATTLAQAAGFGAATGHVSTLAPPAGEATAAANAGWWATLSKPEQQRILASQPELLGNRDGIPAAIRSQANVARIPEERERLNAVLRQAQTDLASVSGGPGASYERSQAEKRVADVQAKLRSLDTVEGMMSKPGHQLMLLDTSGQRAKAAITNGDVDKADHVAVFTPGMNSTVDSLPGYTEDMRELQKHTQDELLQEGRPGSVATVTWLGYEPPSTSEDDLSEAASDDRAQAGAKSLGSFTDGLSATRTDDPHVTALGHSYGSLTTGIALQDHVGAGSVDDAVFFGSPGIGTDNPADLNIPEGHGYNINARGDLITDIGEMTGIFGGDPEEMHGLHQLSADPYTAPDGRQFTGSVGHSEYTVGDDDQYRTSEFGMARVVGGLDPTP